MPVKSRSNRRRSDRRGPPKNQPSVDEIVEEIRELRQRESESKLDVVRSRIEIGRQLTKLKTATPHGKWAEVRDEIGYDEWTAQQLMGLPGGAVDEQIRGTATDLAASLPVDLKKLATLNRLSSEQLGQALEAWGSAVERMSRKDFHDAVEGILAAARGPGEPMPAPRTEAVQTAGQQRAAEAKDTGRLTQRAVACVGTTDCPTGTDDENAGAPSADGSNSLESSLARLLSACDAITDDLVDGVVEQIQQGQTEPDLVIAAIESIGAKIDSLERVKTALSSA